MNLSNSKKSGTKVSKERLQEIKTSRENVYKRCGYEENFVVNEQTVEEIFDLYDDRFFGGQIQGRFILWLKKASMVLKSFTK